MECASNPRILLKLYYGVTVFSWLIGNWKGSCVLGQETSPTLHV